MLRPSKNVAPHMPSNSWRRNMYRFNTRVFEQPDVVVQRRSRRTGASRLRAAAAALLTLAAGVPSGFAQETPTASSNKAASSLPSAPVPTQTEPLTLRQSDRDFSKPAGRLFGNPINMYRPTTIARADFNNSVRTAGFGQGRQDLSEPLRCDRAGIGEQLRHRD